MLRPADALLSDVDLDNWPWDVFVASAGISFASSLTCAVVTNMFCSKRPAGAEHTSGGRGQQVAEAMMWRCYVAEGVQDLGCTFEPYMDCFMVLAVNPNQELHRRGVRPGDRLMAVNGYSVSDWLLVELQAKLEERPLQLDFEIRQTIVHLASSASDASSIMGQETIQVLVDSPDAHHPHYDQRNLAGGEVLHDGRRRSSGAADLFEGCVSEVQRAEAARQRAAEAASSSSPPAAAGAAAARRPPVAAQSAPPAHQIREAVQERPFPWPAPPPLATPPPPSSRGDDFGIGKQWNMLHKEAQQQRGPGGGGGAIALE